MKKKPRKRVICKTCGKKFIQKYAYRHSVYCSKKCWSDRSPKILRRCGHCGNEFMGYRSEMNRKKFCSKECYSNAQQKLTKEKSHLWKGGKTKRATILRTRAIYLKWRDSVFERDLYICQKCGVFNGNGKKIILNAHHIKPFSEFEELRFEISNGITLCRDCHILEHPHLQAIAAKRIEKERSQLKLW